MAIDIRTMQSAEAAMWDAYVQSHPKANLYHLSAWQSIIQDTYSHMPYYLMAVKKTTKLNKVIDAIAGVLPLVHLKSFIFGNQLISIPFFDMGGVLADDADTEKALLIKAMSIGQRIGANTIELRQCKAIQFSNSEMGTNPYDANTGRGDEVFQPTTHHKQLTPFTPAAFERSNKVRMILELPSSSAELMRSFKSKLRSQVKKALKEGLKAEIGGLELLDDFYEVFLVNMRDLGSPVHSKDLMESVLTVNPNTSRIVVVYQKDKPLACGFVIGFRDTLENPWASSLRKYSTLAPNMLLYWKMLEYACDNGFRFFDFGRSTPEEGTFKFKQQWGGKPQTLKWFYLSLNKTRNIKPISEVGKFQLASDVWKRLPLTITRVLGPRIRKYISL